MSTPNLTHAHDKAAMIAAFPTLADVNGYADGLRWRGVEPTAAETAAMVLRRAELTRGKS